MTNRKIKNAQRNMKLRRILDANAENIFTAAICLNEMGASRAKIADMIEEYRTETLVEWEQFSAADVQNTKVTRALRALDIDFEQVYAVVAHRSPRIEPSICRALAENLGIFLLQINHTFGFGKTRLERLLKSINDFEGKARQRAEKLLDLEFEDEHDTLPDIDALRWRPEKIDREEAQKMRRNLEAVRAIQEGKQNVY